MAYLTNKTYGQGWECKRSFREVNDTCNYIEAPKNGYLDYSGIKVKCERGFQVDKEACIALRIPENAHIGYSGKRWKCNKPYIKKQNNCILPVKN